MILRIRRCLIQHADCLPVQRRPLPLEPQVPDLCYILLPAAMIVLEEQVQCRRAVEVCAVDWQLDDLVGLRDLQGLGWRKVGRGAEVQVRPVAVEF